MDYIRRPLTPEEWAVRVENMRKKGNEMFLNYEEHVGAKRDAPVANRFAIFAFRPAGAAVPVPVVTDYHVRLHVDFQGLFLDTVYRANASLGRSVNGDWAIVPGASIPIKNVSINPTHFVMHDREAGTGYVIPWELYESVMNPWGTP